MWVFPRDGRRRKLYQALTFYCSPYYSYYMRAPALELLFFIKYSFSVLLSIPQISGGF